MLADGLEEVYRKCERLERGKDMGCSFIVG